MKKDIPSLKVEDIAVAILPDGSDPEADIWDVYLLNLRKDTILNVLVNSRGYGEVNGEAVKTTTLRYFFDGVAANTFVKIEVLKKEVLQLANEYWISFNLDDYMYDKKYIFVKGSLVESNFTQIPIIDKRGVMIK